MLLAQNNPQEPQDLGVDIPANFPFLISILQFKIRNFPNPVPNHNVSPFSAVTGKANQRSINYSRLSPEQAVLLFQLVVRKECTLSAPPPPPPPPPPPWGATQCQVTVLGLSIKGTQPSDTN